jgi:glycyl-tRNA synthetase beta chain
MTELLLELGTEDLPARYVLPLADAFFSAVVGGLDRRSLTYGDARSFATPRRIAVLIRNLAPSQAEQVIERRGPPVATAYKNGAPTQAALGFARSCGVEASALAERDGYLHFSTRKPGRPTNELIPEVFEDAFARMDELVPKRMRWGSRDDTFVRPVQWLVALLDREVIPLQKFGLTAGRVTYGHRFHAPGPIALARGAEYEPALMQAKVWADFDGRRTEIKKQVMAAAERIDGIARMMETLLEEVTALVEWPVAISGCMEARFMALPPEVIIATIEHNQRYFPVFNAHGGLLPHFITIANIESCDVAQVIAGNERVVRPRLADALFFFEQDSKQALSAYESKLSQITYLKGMGTLADKALRLRELAKYIASLIQENPEQAGRAAYLCKCDLATHMVYEFPELQGIIGGHYARANGEAEAVCRAIAEHYQPVGSSSPVPATALGRIIALADKIDLLSAIFATGQKPTAAKDPLGARRAALGVLRILIEGGMDLDIRVLLERTFASLPEKLRSKASQDDVFQFTVDRLRAYSVESGSAADAVEATLASPPHRALDFHRRLRAVEQFRELPQAASLAAANKRIRNILKQATESGGAAFDPSLCVEPHENRLATALDDLEGKAASSFERADYAEGLYVLSALRDPVDAFFDHVMVMCEDCRLRDNRIALLRRLSDLFLRVADISRLQA